MKNEPYAVRLEMAYMHDDFIERLNFAMKEGNHVEVCWLCYAIFEQRITRIISKHLLKCPKGKRCKDEKPVGISTKILCLQKLVKIGYGPYQSFDGKLLNKIGTWCARRNALIHGLVSLDKYKNYDAEFKELAISGYPLVMRLYEEAGNVRTWCQQGNHFSKFPEIKCRCKHRCICEEN